MLILALDQATKTGWALGDSKGMPESGAKVIKDPWDEVELAFWRLRDFLWELHEAKGKPDLLVYERRLNSGAMNQMRDERKRSPASQEVPLALSIAIADYCYQTGVTRSALHPQTVRKHFIQQARGRKGDPTIKRAVLGRCIAKGYITPPSKRPGDTNPILDQADALAMWDYAACVRGGRSDTTDLLRPDKSWGA